MADIIPSSTFDNGYSKCMVGTFNGPAVYVTGGFVVNLQPTFLFPVLGMVELSELPSGTDVSGVTFTFAALGI